MVIFVPNSRGGTPDAEALSVGRGCRQPAGPAVSRRARFSRVFRQGARPALLHLDPADAGPFRSSLPRNRRPSLHALRPTASSTGGLPVHTPYVHAEPVVALAMGNLTLPATFATSMWRMGRLLGGPGSLATQP